MLQLPDIHVIYKCYILKFYNLKLCDKKNSTQGISINIFLPQAFIVHMHSSPVYNN